MNISSVNSLAGTGSRSIICLALLSAQYCLSIIKPSSFPLIPLLHVGDKSQFNLDTVTGLYQKKTGEQ